MKTITFGFDFCKHLNLDEGTIKDAQYRLKKTSERIFKSPDCLRMFNKTVEDFVKLHGNKEDANTQAMIVWFFEESLFVASNGNRYWNNTTAALLCEGLRPYFRKSHEEFKALPGLRGLSIAEFNRPAFNMPHNAPVWVDQSTEEEEKQIRHAIAQESLNKLGGLSQELKENTLIKPRFLSLELDPNPDLNYAEEATMHMFEAFKHVDNGKHETLWTRANRALKVSINLGRSISGHISLLCSPLFNVYDCLRIIKHYFGRQLQDRVNNPELVEYYEALAPAPA